MIFRLAVLVFIPGALHAGNLQFKQTSVELTPVAASPSVTAVFPFTNTSDKPIHIARFESECSCMTIETQNKEMTIAPGKSGELKGTFVVGSYTGTVDKTIRVWEAGDPADKPSSTLKIKVHIPDLVTIEPKTTSWTLKSSPGSQIVHCRFPSEAPAKITAITSSDPKFATKIKTIEANRSYEIEISCNDTASKALGIIRIETDSVLPSQKSSQAFAVVK